MMMTKKNIKNLQVPKNNQFQAAYAGVFPSKDAWGEDLPEPRASMAGKPLFGGPWALTEIRQGGFWI